MITFAIERFGDVYEELKPILESHYSEISTHKHNGFDLNPQVSSYQAMEADGSLMMVIGRECGKIVAYFVSIIRPALHYADCLTCHPDIFYVEKSRRGAMNGVKMFRFVESELKRRGVKRWSVGSKVDHDASALFEYLGFSPVEKTYEKWL